MNFHVIIGEDDYLLDETARKVIGDGVGLEVIDSANSSNEELRLADIREAETSFFTPPFLEPRKVTWWKNVRFLPANGGKKDEKASEAVKEALDRLASRLAAGAPTLPENQHFILSGPRLLKTSLFAKTLSTVAEMVVFAAGKPWEMQRMAVERVTERAREMGFAFASGVADKFVARVGTDTRSLLGELAKLRDYLGPGQSAAEASDVEAITSQGVGVEPEVWAITDALGERNLEKALTATRRFEGESGFAVLVTTVVEKFFRQLVDLKSAAERGELDAATAGMNPYAVRKNTAFLRAWSLAELRAARFRFLTLREKVVSGLASGDQLVFAELVRAVRKDVR